MRRRWVVGTFTVCALFAGAVAIFTSDDLHRMWGSMAACAYALAAIAVMAWKSRGTDLALAISVAGALAAPLAWMGWHGEGEPEVAVVARSAEILIHHGTPFESAAALAATHDPNAYNPYLPAMSVFGVLRAVAGSGVLTDPRVWFGLTFLVVFGLALKVAGARDYARWALLVAASPIIAFELVVGGTDVPMVSFLCLGFALLWKRPQPVLAGLALGIAAAMKATAWPALVVAFALLAYRDGRRAALIFTGTALAVVAVLVVPFAALRPGPLVQNTILFPLGLARIKSAAVSPLPGHLLAGTGHLGHLAVVALLGLTGLAIAVSLVVRPPGDVQAAVWRLVVGLTIMFVLAPATRFGYFIYPAALVAWLLVCVQGQVPSGSREPQLAGEAPGG
jgi:4-amino-4-deoxy-L-arabinose transferase-like glycosyltransferase